MALSTMIDNWVALNDVPSRVKVLAKDLIAYKRRTLCMETDDVIKNSNSSSGFITIIRELKCWIYLEYSIVR